ncbi:hypothetical protein [Ancylobacter amanitiformis]|uniref:Uncharacterized protein n=1 Tax=Ancylobacter amanitiformis TaxID=217069 RepID=A0ABU0LQ77_9HYPH|nr:hypothetical protein [Ancylobacter amanitiformis]MDQ0510813.1 hypothetical protein [Ancylobacter amanitiformis]
MMNDPRNRRRAQPRVLAIRMEDLRQAMIRRAFMAVSAGLAVAAGLAVVWHGF